MFTFFKKKKSHGSPWMKNQDRGILVFENTSEVIRAENVLKSKGWKIRVMGPPPEIRSGCDLVIEFPLIEELNILRTLHEVDVSPLQVVPVNSPLLQPVNLFQAQDLRTMRVLRSLAACMMPAVDTHPLGGCHASRQPQPEPKEM